MNMRCIKSKIMTKQQETLFLVQKGDLIKCQAVEGWTAAVTRCWNDIESEVEAEKYWRWSDGAQQITFGAKKLQKLNKNVPKIKFIVRDHLTSAT